MPLKTSFFNKTIFRKNLTRFWPIWALYGLIWALVFPLSLANNLFSPYSSLAKSSLGVTAYVLNMLIYGGTLLSTVFGIIAAMAVFSYLYTSKSVGMMHSLPIRREGLFLSNYLSGLCFFVIPHIFIFLLALIVEAGSGIITVGPLLIWLGGTTALSLFFYSFAVFCAMFTGHILALPVFYGILNFLVPGMEFLIRTVLDSFVFGYTINYSRFLTLFLSPPVKLLSDLRVQAIYSDSGNNDVIGYWLAQWHLLYGYAGAGLVFAVLALLVYRYHRSESAGDVVAIHAVRPVFKYGVAFCSALALGQLFYFVFAASMLSYSNFDPWILLLCMIVLGFVGYFAAEMLLKKSFRVFSTGYKGFLVVAVALILFVSAMEFDFAQYERTVPNAKDVASVSIDTYGAVYPYYRRELSVDSSDAIEEVIALHTEIANNKKTIEKAISEYSANLSNPSIAEVAPDTIFYPGNEASTTSFTLTYTLTNGKTIARAYTIPVTTEALANETSLCARYSAILNDRQHILGDLFPPDLSTEDITGGVVAFNGNHDNVELTGDEARTLYSSIYEDAQAGNIANVYLLDNNAYYKTVYDNDIVLYFTGTYPGWTYSTGKYDSHGVTICPEVGSLSTIAALTKLGIVTDETPLVTRGLSYATGPNAQLYD